MARSPPTALEEHLLTDHIIAQCVRPMRGNSTPWLLFFSPTPVRLPLSNVTPKGRLFMHSCRASFTPLLRNGPATLGNFGKGIMITIVPLSAFALHFASNLDSWESPRQALRATGGGVDPDIGG